MSTPRGTARRLRRASDFSRTSEGYEPQQHQIDHEGICVHCGFDSVEEYHLRVLSVPPGAREKRPACATYCGRRPWVRKSP